MQNDIVQRQPDAGIASVRSEGGSGLAQAFGNKSEQPLPMKKKRKRNPKRVLWRDRARPGWRERRARLLREREQNSQSPSADCRDGL